MGLALAQLGESERSQEAFARASALASGGPEAQENLPPAVAHAPAVPATNDTVAGNASLEQWHPAAALIPPLRMDTDPSPLTLVASAVRPGDPALSLAREHGSGTTVFEVPSSAQVVTLAPHALELKWAGATVIARPATGVEIGMPDRSRLEVSNGNGVTGMARKIDGLLQAIGLAKARLTNQKPFTQQLTEIQYRDGHVSAAASLSTRLPNRPAIVRDSRLRADIDLRLVLGRDLPSDVALVEPAADGARWAADAHRGERP
jgi:hypothetical protein